MRRLEIIADGVRIVARLRETPTAERIWLALPIAARVSTWGDEIYFATPVQCAREADAKDVVDAGEIAFWPDGDAIAIGFGPTPISQGSEIRLASPCNVWADAEGDVRDFGRVRSGASVTVRALD
ncbi:MAG: cyclophilin-like fold protein [Hyphomicrobiaceae bacterium]